MADIFVSYASEDRERVRGLVELLESHGWSVWWDRSLKAGETWPDVIERELGRARCVLVVWSNDAGARRHYELALQLTEQALSVNPESADALAHAGALHAAFGNEQQALALATQALEASPDDSEVHRVAAVTYLRLGNPEGAIQQIARAVELGYPQSMLARDPMFDELSRRKEFPGVVGSN
jgi:tetratricopeptide (TPR) repeat protein